MDTHNFPERDGEETERVPVTKVLLAGEGQPGDVIKGSYIPRFDPGRFQLLLIEFNILPIPGFFSVFSAEDPTVLPE